MPDTLQVTKIQRFCTHDGPGIRTTVFLKGCPLRCAWCHNPEGQSPRNQLMYAEKLCVYCGECERVCPSGVHHLTDTHLIRRERCISCGRCADACPTNALTMAATPMSIPQIIEAAQADRAFYGKSGGLTLSGGEPMLHGEKAIDLLRAAKEKDIHTAVETCGYFPSDLIPALAQTADLLLWDYKDSDPIRHRQHTSVDNQLILQHLHALDALGAAIELRCILVKGVNLNKAHLAAIAGLYRDLTHVQRVTLLPYHAFGSAKAVQLGQADPARMAWIPTPQDMAQARAYLTDQDVPLGE